jgi:hypothetical protein
MVVLSTHTERVQLALDGDPHPIAKRGRRNGAAHDRAASAASDRAASAASDRATLLKRI